MTRLINFFTFIVSGVLLVSGCASQPEKINSKKNINVESRQAPEVRTELMDFNKITPQQRVKYLMGLNHPQIQYHSDHANALASCFYAYPNETKDFYWGCAAKQLGKGWDARVTTGERCNSNDECITIKWLIDSGKVYTATVQDMALEKYNGLLNK